jgi:hypothetical protein
MSDLRLLCVIGKHRWAREKNDGGGAYLRCSRCGKDNASIPAVREAAGADNQAWPR